MTVGEARALEDAGEMLDSPRLASPSANPTTPAAAE